MRLQRPKRREKESQTKRSQLLREMKNKLFYFLEDRLWEYNTHFKQSHLNLIKFFKLN